LKKVANLRKKHCWSERERERERERELKGLVLTSVCVKK
jgi:hypothetical protein